MTPEKVGRPVGTVEDNKRIDEKNRRVRELQADLEANSIELPLKVFLYTLDQIAYMMDVTETSLKASIVYFQGRDMKRQHRTQLRAVNISSVNKSPEWRVAEDELIRWCKIRKITFTQPIGTRARVPAAPRKNARR